MRRLAPVGSTLVRNGGDWLALELFDVLADPEERHNLLAGERDADPAAVLAERMPGLAGATVRVGDRERDLVEFLAAARPVAA
jgi:hypothetical protein